MKGANGFAVSAIIPNNIASTGPNKGINANIVSHPLYYLLF
jgi:hypothetical protein